MIYTVSITKKGQMTIPKDVRERLGVDAPGKVTLDVDIKGRLTLHKPVAIEDIRTIVGKPAGKKPFTEREKLIIPQVMKKKKYAEFFQKAR
ncbi:MAG TPA: AbrB/MazE/SpoVT family DNA-binding domain-containing protein [Candidatus Limnocylindria bacterium]|nr:AbrB/MazE/SpoVT family DNA-binding domain-containing protein [Candidatus Limnocylindria bacterium]